MDKKTPTQSTPKQIFSRSVRLEDFLDESDDTNNQSIKNNKYNKNNSYNDTNIIAKNQQEFGHKKRIKP